MKHYDTVPSSFLRTELEHVRPICEGSSTFHFLCHFEYLQAANADWRGDLRRADDQRRFFQHDFAGFDVPGCDIMPPNFAIVDHAHRRTINLVGLPILLLVIRRTIKNLKATGTTRFACFIAHKAVSCGDLGLRTHHSTVKSTVPDKNFIHNSICTSRWLRGKREYEYCLYEQAFHGKSNLFLTQNMFHVCI